MHDRAHVRFHRDRIVHRRQREHALQAQEGMRDRHLPDGRLEDHQAYFACPRPRCGLCHPPDPGRRQRERRGWQQIEAAAW
jgi:hypothetical protein